MWSVVVNTVCLLFLPSLEIGKKIELFRAELPDGVLHLQDEPITMALCDTCVSCDYNEFVKVGVNAPLEAWPSPGE